MIARQLAPGEANDLVTQNSEAGITSAIVLKGGSGPMCVPAIDFNDEALFGPREIDDEAADPNIHFRLEKAVAATERKETPLQLAARAIRLERVVEREPEELRLPKGRGELRRRKRAAEVPQGSRGSGHRDREAPGDLAVVERSGPVEHDALALPAARLSWARDVHIDVNTGWGRRAATPQHAPELGRAGVAQHSRLPTGEHRRHPSSGLAQTWVPNGEDPAVNAVKAPRLDSAQATPLANAGRIELGHGDDTVLARSQARNYGVRITIGALPTHVGG